MSCFRLPALLLLGTTHAIAIPVLFSGWGPGQFGLVAATPTVNLAGNITSAAVNRNVTIKGDGSTLVVLLYNGSSSLNVNKSFTLTGLSADQVLLNVTSGAGITTSAAFNYTGALAVKDTTEIFTGATINGRVYLGGTGNASLNSGFNLTSPADLVTPEPATEVLIGGALVLLVVVSRKLR